MTPLRARTVRHVILPANLIVAALIVFGVLASTVEGDLRLVPPAPDADLPRAPAADGAAPPQEATTADAAHRARLTVRVVHVRSAAGKVLVWVYGKGPLQDGANIVARQELPASTDGVTAVFDDLPRGTYAVMAVHDENRNSELDLRAAGGPPAEGVGVSGPATTLRGPPTFEDARIVLDRGQLEIEVPVVYAP